MGPDNSPHGLVVWSLVWEVKRGWVPLHPLQEPGFKPPNHSLRLTSDLCFFVLQCCKLFTLMKSDCIAPNLLSQTTNYTRDRRSLRMSSMGV